MNALMPAAIDALEFEESAQDVLVHDRVHAKIHVLNRSAAIVLRACDGRTPMIQLARMLDAERAPEVCADIAAVLAEFERLELIQS
jgi:hypothetical protein